MGEETKMSEKEKAIYIKAIAHCIANLDDICSKCIYAKDFNEEDFVCKQFDKDGNIACCEGVIKYFEESYKVF